MRPTLRRPHFRRLQEPKDGNLRHLRVQVLGIDETNLHLGGEVHARVEVRNVDKRSIEIPWSADRGIIHLAPDPWHLSWDAATLEFYIASQSGRQLALEGQTEWLYGSEFAAGTYLTLRPGQGISARVALKLAAKYGMELTEGKWQLSAEWHPMGRAWEVKDCGAWDSYFQYTRFYTQSNPALDIEITRLGPTDTH
jgi:hypothetical protein